MTIRSIRAYGTLPDQFTPAFEALSEDLGLRLDPAGFPIEFIRGDALSVKADEKCAQIIWAEPVQAYRALSFLGSGGIGNSLSVKESPCFETLGVMLDVSRNAVILPETMRFLLRKMALMGIQLGMLYTEDTFEIPELPYFGYQRGRYSMEDIRGFDDYANMLGIELCPCIQTLGHLNRALHWPAMQHLKDTEEILLADSEETYSFLETMIQAACAPYRSKRIHIGMDEAADLGMGQYRRKHGYVPRHQIMKRHLAKVLEIVRGCGLEPLMWSDMYFRPQSPTGGYYDSGDPNEASREAVCPGVTMVYWDYYHETEEHYGDMLRKHRLLNAPTAFAGGIWTFTGPAPDYTKTFATTLPALNVCKEAGVPLVLATAWGDNGAECNVAASLAGMQLFAEYTYTGEYDASWLAQRFTACCHADIHAFTDLSRFNTVPGMQSGPMRPVNAAKFLLYQDPLVQLFEKDTEGLRMSAHYAALHRDYQEHAKQNPAFAQLFSFYGSLAQTLAKKCAWHEQAGPCVRAGDRLQAAELAALAGEVATALEGLRTEWQKLWMATNRPQGFEILDLRLGGMRARFCSAQRRMQEFAQNTVQDIPELSCEPLAYTLMPENKLNGSYAWGEIASACKLDI